MGWRPDHVRASTLHDFECAVDGFLAGRGVVDNSLSDKDRAELLKAYDEAPETIT